MSMFDKMRAKEAAVSPALLAETFSYCPETGVLTWKNSKRAYKNGCEAGRVITDLWGKSYRYVPCGGFKFMAHRIIWAIVKGQWPEHQIDHCDGNGLNNKIDNLRHATNQQNGMNQKKRTPASGHTGVRWHKGGKKWNARIKAEGREISLGLYVNIDDAVAARKAAEKKYGFSEGHGEER